MTCCGCSPANSPTARSPSPPGSGRWPGWRVGSWRPPRRAVRLANPGDQWRADGDAADATPLTDQADAYAWLEAERLNLLATGRQATETPGPVARMVGPLAAALFRFLQMGGYWADLKDLNQAALTLHTTLGLPEAEELRRLLEETPVATE